LITIPLYYYYGLEGIVPALIVMSIGTLAVASYFSRKVTIPFYIPSHLEIKEKGKGMLKLGFFLSLSGLIATLVSYLLRIYISNTGSVDDVGLYSAGFQIIGTYVGLVFTAMGTDYYPRLAAVSGDQKQANLLVNQQAEIALLILLPIVLIFIVFIPLVVKILYSEKFLPINEMIVWAAYGMFFKAGSWAIAFQFLAKGSSRLFFFNEFSTNMYMFLLNILGYHYFGLTGLGFSFLLTYFIYFFQVLWLTNYKYQFKIQVGFIKFLLISLFFGACCLALISYFNEFLRYLIGGSIAALAVIIAIWELEKRINILSFFNKKR
jgi:O-antigen/teichoic acid export membrane protein